MAKTKESFGCCSFDHSRPANLEPKAINIVVSFEEALKLHLSIGEAIRKLNSYNRRTKEGKESAVNICIYPNKQQITVNENKLRQRNRDEKD